MFVFVAIFTLGTGLKPKQDPLPVVKQIILLPALGVLQIEHSKGIAKRFGEQ